jgi:hypothetical protein
VRSASSALRRDRRARPSGRTDSPGQSETSRCSSAPQPETSSGSAASWRLPARLSVLSEERQPSAGGRYATRLRASDSASSRGASGAHAACAPGSAVSALPSRLRTRSEVRAASAGGSEDSALLGWGGRGGRRREQAEGAGGASALRRRRALPGIHYSRRGTRGFQRDRHGGLSNGFNAGLATGVHRNSSAPAHARARCRRPSPARGASGW